MRSRIIGAGIVALALAQSNQQAPQAARPSAYRNGAWRFSIDPPEFKAETFGEVTWISEFKGAGTKSEDQPILTIGVAKQDFDKLLKDQESGLLLLGYKISQRKDVHVGKFVGKELDCNGDFGGRGYKEIHLYVCRGDHVFLLFARTPASRFDELESLMRKSLASFSLEE